MKKEYNIGWCPLCDQGWVIIVKDIETSNLFLCCKECETEWVSPNNFTEKSCLPFNTYKKYELPAKANIIEFGWGGFIEAL